jgi:periplasmic nitrate reductase NapE
MEHRRRLAIPRHDMDQRTRTPTGAETVVPTAAGALEAAEITEKKSELRAFLFLTVVMAPVLAGVIVATYGLAVWIYQMFAGPPTG